VAWSGAPDCPVCHQTVRCDSGVTAIQRNGRLQRLLTSATVRDRVRGHRTLNSACPVPLEDKAFNGRQLPNPNSWVTWLAHWTVSGGTTDCSVRPSIAAYPNGQLVVEGYKYPQPPPLQPSKHFSDVCIQYKSNRLHSKTQSKRSIHSKSPIQL
jgi:hypothetical protein